MKAVARLCKEGVNKATCGTSYITTPSRPSKMRDATRDARLFAHTAPQGRNTPWIFFLYIYSTCTRKCIRKDDERGSLQHPRRTPTRGIKCRNCLTLLAAIHQNQSVTMLCARVWPNFTNFHTWNYKRRNLSCWISQAVAYVQLMDALQSENILIRNATGIYTVDKQQFFFVF